MRGYPCQSCGKVFDPEKSDICPACGAAVSPAVLTRIERKNIARWLRTEGQTHYDEHCHEDDAWAGSYGAQTHQAAVRSHEAELRAGYAAHIPADHPSLRAGTTLPEEASGANSQRNAKQSEKKSRAPLLIFFIILVIYFLIRIIPEILENLVENGFSGFGFP